MERRKKKTVDDSVCEVHKFGGYAVLSNCFVRSTNLDCGAIGLLSRIMDFSHKWKFSKAGLVAICPDGETSIDTSLKVLEEWGYVEKRTMMPNESEDGRIHTVYAFYEYSAKDTSIPQYDYELEAYAIDNATLNRVKKDNNFTMISRKLLRNKEIPNKLLGFLLKVLSLPDYWHFSMSGLKAICKEGKTAVQNAVKKLMYNESMHNHFEYVYSFFDVPISKEEADELEAETRRKAITIREGGRAKTVENVEKSAVTSSFIPEKQRVENLSADTPGADVPPSENQVQYNTKDKIQKNQLRSDKSSIIPSAPKKQVFNNSAVENSVERMNEEFNAQEIEDYTEIVKMNIDYWELAEWLSVDNRDGYKEADEIVGFIVDEICSRQPYSTFRGHNFYRSVVQAQMLKVDIYILQSVLEKMAKIDNIKDFRRYFISSLYYETLTYHFNDGCESRNIDEQIRRDFGYRRASM